MCTQADVMIGGEVCFASVKHGKIRIHKNTLSFLGRPEYISLIINPEDHTLGVKGSKVGDGESHYVNRKLFETKQCCVLSSACRSLLGYSDIERSCLFLDEILYYILCHNNFSL